MTSCTPNLVSPETTFDKGTMIRGKYTFPNIPAFAINVPEVDVRQPEK